MSSPAQPAPARILILGGTGEARELAAELVAAGADVISSLAGRVQNPRLPAGAVRVGGFGGAEGLAAFLREERISRLVDATHPFAAGITGNAAVAAELTQVPRLVLRRPAWEGADLAEAGRGDAGLSVPDISVPDIRVSDIQAAAAAVRDWPGESVFLTTGRRDLGVFAGDDRHRFLVRTVEPPDGPVPSRMTLLLDRGPYTVAGETQLMREHGIGLLVTKNSGGSMTEAKLRAARALGVRVVMVERPPLPRGTEVVATVSAALRWLAVPSTAATPDTAIPDTATPGTGAA